ncbi:MAG: ATP-binding protein [Candidatus Gracilibacteria bacterium]
MTGKISNPQGGEGTGDLENEPTRITHPQMVVGDSELAPGTEGYDELVRGGTRMASYPTDPALVPGTADYEELVTGDTVIAPCPTDPNGPAEPRLDGLDGLGDDGETSHEIDETALQFEMHQEIGESALDINDKIKNLPPQQRLIALLGLTKKAEVITLPPEFKAVQITVPRYKLAEAQTAIGELGLPVNDSFLGNPRDPNVTLTYVVPHNVPNNNYLNIIARLKKLQIKFSTSFATNEPVVFRGKGQGLNLVGPDFSEVETHNIAIGRQPAVPEPLEPEIVHESRASFESAKADETRIPRQGACTYLMIEDNFAERIARQKASRGKAKDPYLNSFLNQLAAIYSSKSFCITRQNGYILIIDTAERAGSYLTSLATSIFASSGGSVKALVGSGKISRSRNSKSFSMSGNLPTREETSKGGEVAELMNGMYLHTDIYDQSYVQGKPRERLKGREGSQFHTVAAPVNEGDKWLRLREHKPSVELAVGGPDEFVGYEEELKALESALNDDTTKLTVLKAAAGMGKSRLLAEVAKKNPSMIVMSLDPSGKGVQGSGLVTVAEQLVQYVEANLDKGESVPGIVEEFRHMSHPQKISLAQKSPQHLTALCNRAFRFLRSKLGNLKIVLDDVHHVDRHSDPYLMSMMSGLISGDNQDKVVLSMREEERYKSTHQKKLESQVFAMDERALKTIKLNGLDFNDEIIAGDFIYHSLPAEFRQGKRLGGDWWKKLGKKAGKLPLAMVSFMDAIMVEHQRLTKEERPSVLTDPENQIMLSNEFLEHLESLISEGDLGRYYEDKLDKLPENLKTFMQSVALLGGEVTIAQLNRIARINGNVSKDDLDNILIPGRYLAFSGGKYKMQHQTIVAITVDSMDHQQRVDLSTKLSKAFSNDKSISDDTKLALLHSVAHEAKAGDHVFWAHYGDNVTRALARAKATRSYGNSYGTAMSVFGMSLEEVDLLSEGAKTVMQKTLSLLEGKPSPEGLSSIRMWLAMNTLDALSSGAMALGKYNEADLALKKLEKALELHPDGRLELMQSVAFNRFQLAYLKRDVPAMEALYATEIQKVFSLEEHDGLKAVMEVQIAYITDSKPQTGTQKREDGQVKKLYDEKARVISVLRQHPGNTEAYGAYLEASRIANCRAPFEAVRRDVIGVRLTPDEKRSYDMQKASLNNAERAALLKQMGNKRLDEDVLYQRLVLNPDQLSRLEDVEDVIKYLTGQQQLYPDAFNPQSGMSFLDVKAQVAAMLGRQQEAVEILSEYWRQADQLGIYPDAARSAKIKGDIQMIQAFSTHRIDRDIVFEAIRTYSEEGVKSLTSLDKENPYQATIRINRIRAIGALALSYDDEISVRSPGEGEVKQMLEEFGPHLETALKDFNYLNEKLSGEALNGDYQYTILGYLGPIFNFAKKMGLDVPDLKTARANYPYLSDEGFKNAATFAEGIEDNPVVDLGEKRRKIAGMQAMKELLGVDLAA